MILHDKIPSSSTTLTLNTFPSPTGYRRFFGLPPFDIHTAWHDMRLDSLHSSCSLSVLCCGHIAWLALLHGIISHAFREQSFCQREQKINEMCLTQYSEHLLWTRQFDLIVVDGQHERSEEKHTTIVNCSTEIRSRCSKASKHETATSRAWMCLKSFQRAAKCLSRLRAQHSLLLLKAKDGTEREERIKYNTKKQCSDKGISKLVRFAAREQITVGFLIYLFISTSLHDGRGVVLEILTSHKTTILTVDERYHMFSRSLSGRDACVSAANKAPLCLCKITLDLQQLDIVTNGRHAHTSA